MSKKYEIKICPECGNTHRKRGVTCCSECTDKMMNKTKEKNNSEVLRRKKISETMKNKFRDETWKKSVLDKRFESLENNFGELGYSNPLISEKRYETKRKNNTLPNSESVLKRQYETKSKNGTLPNSPKVIEKGRNTLLSKGQEFMNEINRKRNETFKKNRTFTRSKSADLFFETFSSLNFEREFQVNDKKSWFIDFYSHEHNIYVQFDGVYWHGLDGRITERVARHIEIDKRQNEYFEKNNLKLYRVTDVSFFDMQASYKNSLSCNNNVQGTSHKMDNPELALEILHKIAYFKTSATTIEKQSSESDKSNLIGISRVDQKIDRNREILQETEILSK